MDINGEKHITKSDELLKYFEIIMEKQNNNPIVKVYSKYYDDPDNTEKVMYDIDTEFYILLKKSICFGN